MFLNYYLHIISRDKEICFYQVEINRLNIFSQFLNFVHVIAHDQACDPLPMLFIYTERFL